MTLILITISISLIIMVIIKKNFVNNQSQNYTNTNVGDIYANTLKNNKKQAYNNLNDAHKDHKIDNYNNQQNNYKKNIGYKKCPNCGNSISINSEKCFMCDYVFKAEAINENQDHAC